MAMLAEVLAFLQRENGASWWGGIAEVLGKGCSCLKYPCPARCVHNPLRIKYFHEALAGHVHECLLKLRLGKARSEILGITWPNVDFQRRMIRLLETKNGESRAVPLTGFALQEMQRLAKVRRIDSPYVFPGRNGVSPVNLWESWRYARLRAGITDFRFHDPRHSAASYLAMNGASLAEIAEVLGHKTLAMVKRYAHLSEQHTARVVERMNTAIFGKVAG